MKSKIAIAILAWALVLSLYLNQEERQAYQNYIQTSTEYINTLEETVDLLEQTLEIKNEETQSLWEVLRLTKDYQSLLRITEAEARGEGYEGKLYVAAVVINRAKHDRFAGNIMDVIYAPGQFDPVANGSINRVKVTEETQEAVDAIIRSQILSESLYFMNPAGSGEVSRGWMRTKKLVATIGNHEFYTEW